LSVSRESVINRRLSGIYGPKQTDITAVIQFIAPVYNLKEKRGSGNQHCKPRRIGQIELNFNDSFISLYSDSTKHIPGSYVLISNYSAYKNILDKIPNTLQPK